MNIYIVDNGEERGPLTVDEVAQLVAAGSLKPDDPAFLEGDAEWGTVAKVLRLSTGSSADSAVASGGGVQPMASISRDFKNIKRNSSATVSELREFMREMRGKSPREMLGAIAQSTLVLSTIVSTVAIFILVVVLTVVPYGVNVWRKSKSEAISRVEEAGEREKASKGKASVEPTAPVSKPKENKPADVLGVGQEKTGKPNEVNPFENKGDLLVDPSGK
jgi:hypothetical protein